MSRKKSRPVPYPAGPRIFQRIFTRLGCPGRPPHFQVEFYPYANLTSTVRVRNEAVIVRLSDLLRRARLPAIEAAAALLLARLYRVPLPGKYIRAYREYTLARPTRRRLMALRRRRISTAPQKARGNTYDLAELFARLNREYFGGRIRRPWLAWSARPWRTQLGCYDPALHQIVLNTKLDRPAVPRYVVEYVLYHEMLHARLPARRSRCGLELHSAAFRRAEKCFRHYQAARRYLSSLR